MSNLKIILFLTAITAVASTHTKVHINNLKTFTAFAGQLTTNRRVPPILQMVCVGSYCDPMYTPKTMQCYNKGIHGNLIQWECKAEIDVRYKLDRHEVSCEGYNHRDDKMKLVGSCGVKYNMILNPLYRPPVKITQPSSTTTNTTMTTTPIDKYNVADLLGFGIFIFMMFVLIVEGCHHRELKY